jgi:SLT domain-containing protein
LFKTLSEDGNEATNTMEEIANSLNTIAGAINAVASAYRNAKKLGNAIFRFINIGPDGAVRYNPQTGKYEQKAAGGSVTGGKPYVVGEFGPEVFVPAGSGSIRQGGSGGTTIINLNGIVDAASARKSIERLLQTQSRISGPINLAGAMP